MHPHIAQALEHLQNANYAGYFEEMDKVAIPAQFQNPYATHKNSFMAGEKSFEFSQRLTVLAQEVGKIPASEVNKQENQNMNGISNSKNLIVRTTIGNIGGDFKIGDSN